MELPANWRDLLSVELAKPYFRQLSHFIESEYATQTVYPPLHLVFNAFAKCPFAEVKVVILGQDPYHGAGQANGLGFSVNDGVPLPPSLKNIFREIQQDLGKAIPKSGNLERWASQGVLLLNAILTVRAQQAASHQNKGWEQFTDAVVRLISNEQTPVVFLLWGKYAQAKGKQVDGQKHKVLTSGHPSPLSAKQFFGQRHFSQTNEYLKKVGKSPIEW